MQEHDSDAFAAGREQQGGSAGDGRVGTERESVLARLDAIRADLETAWSDRDAVAARSRDLDAELEEARDELRRAREERDAWRVELDAAREERDEARTTTTRLEAERNELRARLLEHRAELESATARLTSLREENDGVRTQAGANAVALDRARRELDVARAALDEIRSSLEGALAERASLVSARDVARATGDEVAQRLRSSVVSLAALLPDASDAPVEPAAEPRTQPLAPPPAGPTAPASAEAMPLGGETDRTTELQPTEREATEFETTEREATEFETTELETTELETTELDSTEHEASDPEAPASDGSDLASEPARWVHERSHRPSESVVSGESASAGVLDSDTAGAPDDAATSPSEIVLDFAAKPTSDEPSQGGESRPPALDGDGDDGDDDGDDEGDDDGDREGGHAGDEAADAPVGMRAEGEDEDGAADEVHASESSAARADVGADAVDGSTDDGDGAASEPEDVALQWDVPIANDAGAQAEGGAEVRTSFHGTRARRLAWNPASTTVLVGGDGEGESDVVAMLLSADGYRLATVHDGREALAWLKENTPDLAVLDASMPYVDGVDVCSRMKRISRLRRTPVVILSGRHDEVVLDSARAAGADAIIRKPLEGKALRDRVHDLLGNAAARRLAEDEDA